MSGRDNTQETKKFTEKYLQNYTLKNLKIIVITH